MKSTAWIRCLSLTAFVLLSLALPGTAAADGGTLTAGEEASQSQMPERISAGWTHTCGVKSFGTVACWG